MKKATWLFHALILLCIASGPVAAQAAAAARGAPVMLAQAQSGAASAEERIANLKAWLNASKEALHHYTWIETTTVSHQGEVKSTTQNRCVYGMDGTLQKQDITPPSDKKSGGLPGILPPGRLLKHVEEHEEKEMKQYIEEAKELVQTYVPPDPNLIQATVHAGNFSISPIDPGREVELTFKDYHKSGDALSVDIGIQNNQLLGLKVATYLDDPSDAVTLDVTEGVLPDGTIYTEKTVLNAPAKQLVITVANSDYQKIGQ